MAAFERKFRLDVPSETGNLALIREFVAQIASQNGLDEKETNMLALAVDEACTNVMEHAYAMDASQEVTVRVSIDGRDLRIQVVDTGKGFDPTAIPQSSIDQLVEQRKNGGLGLRLMQMVMDEVNYQIVPGVKNELTMVKRLR